MFWAHGCSFVVSPFRTPEHRAAESVGLDLMARWKQFMMVMAFEDAFSRSASLFYSPKSPFLRAFLPMLHNPCLRVSPFLALRSGSRSCHFSRLVIEFPSLIRFFRLSEAKVLPETKHPYSILDSLSPFSVIETPFSLFLGYSVASFLDLHV